MQSNRNINRRLAEYFLSFFIWSLKIQGVENYVVHVFQIEDFILNRNNPIPYHKSLYLSLLPRSQNFSLTFLEREVISPYFSRPAGRLLYSHRRRLEAGNFGFRKKSNCTICVAKTKALISFAVTAKLICAFVFSYVDCWFSHAVAQIKV